MNQILRFFPALQVHSWGGFGSQLYTAFVILKLQQSYPGRRIKVVIHTSGVTRMVKEFNFGSLGVQVVQIEDFKSTKSLSTTNKYQPQCISSFLSVSKQLLLKVLVQLRILVKVNTDDSFELITFWTMSLRGHYTNLTLDKPLVDSLYRVLFTEESQFKSRNCDLVVHYRLGDLLTLPQKHPISVERVERVLEKLKVDLGSLVLLSDSKGEDLVKFLESSKLLKFSKSSNYDPIKTLRICIDAEKFVGTGAKLSLWAATFRYFVHGKVSFLPTDVNWARESGVEANWY